MVLTVNIFSILKCVHTNAFQSFSCASFLSFAFDVALWVENIIEKIILGIYVFCQFNLPNSFI